MDILELEKNIHLKYKELTNYLISSKLSISTMESCTSGLIASLITDTDGASEIMKGAFVTYSNEAKILQGVNKETIELHGVYSKETAIEMANSCKNIYNSSIGIGVTGTLSTLDKNNKDSMLGNVFVGINFNESKKAYSIVLPPIAEKGIAKLYVADEIYKFLKESLNKDN